MSLSELPHAKVAPEEVVLLQIVSDVSAWMFRPLTKILAGIKVFKNQTMYENEPSQNCLL